jgi:hypothetical protein
VKTLGVVAVVLALFVGCGTAEPVASTPTTAARARDQLPITYFGGQERFDAPGDAVARMTKEEALAAAGGDHGSGEPVVLFALYTNYGQGQMNDTGGVTPAHVRQPVWLVRQQDVPQAPPRRMPGDPIPSSPPPTTRADVGVIVDDATGAVMESFGDQPDDPPAAPRPGDEPTVAGTCPADHSEFKTELRQEEGTPLPTGFVSFTRPWAVVRASNGDAYEVWGGAGSPELPLTGPADKSTDGTISVRRHRADPCAGPRSDESLVFHHEPSATGELTLVSIDGDRVHYRTAGGASGEYNVVTATFE